MIEGQTLSEFLKCLSTRCYQSATVPVLDEVLRVDITAYCPI